MAFDGLDIGPVGVWIPSTRSEARREEFQDSAAQLEELGYGALWLGAADGGLQLPESLLASTRRLVVATGIVNVWTNPAATLASSYQRVNAAHPDRLVVGLGASHAVLVGDVYRRPLQRLSRYLDELDEQQPSVPVNRRVLAARTIARQLLATTLARLPNYTNNFLRLGFSPADLEAGGSSDDDGGHPRREEWRRLAEALVEERVPR
jgi:hypothetical protein